MHWFTILATASAVTAATLESRITRPKANEYKSPDCSGALNFGHNRFGLGDVTMDDTSNSVYTNVGNSQSYTFYSGKTGNGGSCSGAALCTWINTDGSCHNLNTPAGCTSGRVKCVRFNYS